MEDYYDYYISKPPQSHGKSLTFPPASEPQSEFEVPEMNFTTKYVPGSLGTIDETEKESMTSSESYRRKDFEKFDSFALEPDEVNKRFLTFLRERNKDIDVIELEDKIGKELDLDISDEEVRKVIGELNFKNKELREGKIRNKDVFPYDVERLKEEILELKRQNNYDKAVIKLLKINLRKGRGGHGRTENLATKQKEKEKLLLKLQEVYDENVKLKQQIQTQDQDYKQKISKLNALNSEMTKMLNAKYPVANDKNASKGDSAAAQVAVLRLKMKSLTEEKDELKEKVAKYEGDMVKLRQTIEERDPARFESQISQLREEKEGLVTEKEFIMEEMKLDKQLSTLFPNTGNLALITLNFAYQVEKNRFIRTTYNKSATRFLNLADKAFKKIMPAFESMGNRIMFHLTKNSEYHPDTKKMVQATITAWNSSSFVGKHIKSQNDEIKVLEERIKQLEHEVEHAGVAGRPFKFLREEAPKKKDKGEDAIQNAFSVKNLEELKKQWDELPAFVKKYIKQLEGDIMKAQLKKDRKLVKKKKEALKAAGEEEKGGNNKIKKVKKENQELPAIVDKKVKEKGGEDLAKTKEKKENPSAVAALGMANKIKKDLAPEIKPKKTGKDLNEK